MHAMILVRCSLCAVALLGLLSARPAAAQEWTRFRGPNGTGVSDAKSVPAAWTENDFNWRVELPGGGHSSPVIWKDKIFLTSADHDTAQRQVLCLSTRDGSIVWKRDYGSTVHDKHNLNSFASPTPTVDEDRVYVAWSAPEEYSLRAFSHDGQELWHADLGPYESQHSCGASPVIFEDLIILGNDQDGPSSLTAVDRATGKVVWNVPRKNTNVAYSTPCVYQPEGEAPELIFNSNAHGITAINPDNGATIWEVADCFDKRSVSSPVIAGGKIFGSCGSGGGGNYVVAVTPGSQRDPSAAKLAYRLDKSAPYVPTPVALGDRIFLWSDGGVATCVDASTGEVVWTQRVGGTYYGSPVCVGGRIYCMSTAGEAVVLAAADEFEELARNPVLEFSHSTPAVSDGVMYLRTFTHLISIGGVARVAAGN
jgi:outer membrane protein assembly factor BamB